MYEVGKTFRYGSSPWEHVTIYTYLLDEFPKDEAPTDINFKFLRVSSSSDKGIVLQLLQGNKLFLIAVGDNIVPATLSDALFKNSDGRFIPIYVAEKDCGALRDKLKKIGIGPIDIHSVYNRFYELYGSELSAGSDRPAECIYEDISTVFAGRYVELVTEFPDAPTVSDTCDVTWSDICKRAPVYCYHCFAMKDIKAQQSKPKSNAKSRQTGEHGAASGSPAGNTLSEKSSVKKKKTPQASPGKGSVTVEFATPSDGRRGNKKNRKSESDESGQKDGGSSRRRKGSSPSLPISKRFESDEEAREFAKTLSWERCMVIEKNSSLDLAELHLMCTNNGSYLSYVSDNYIFYGFPRSQEVNVDTYRRSMSDTNMFLV
ncbi:hypothetical protein GL50803_006120 [Giardia duodenalis]|uniref:Uncharacterized protein n=1 Tax=Giardia intestinalis (strain ATCC 50803 / WB clone C6) TaxID=184922 RepID=A8BLE4_GIAIC|nr:hypothetical protein GL50803_006120 [Giardia intestinalis]KAE8302744.1 hypothetical protein GL50803_006120 [Giardia intestinalis]|eukprot:XP_001706278.1 Hypothetical protein GL50803_6120 [Giardia lamblia ATCC 50803]